jgi:hypothetical protein
MSLNIVRLYYKENSKEPAIHEALIDLSKVSMIVRIGQQTVGLVVPGGWYEYSLVTDNLTGIEKTTRSADKYIELTDAWTRVHGGEPEPVKKVSRKAAVAPAPFPEPAPVVEKAATVPASPTARNNLTAMADKLIAAGVPLPPQPAPMVRPPVQELPPRTMASAHPFRDPSGLPTMIDLRDVTTISGFTDGSNKVRLGLARGGARTVFVILKDGEAFETAYTALYEKWYALNYNS